LNTTKVFILNSKQIGESPSQFDLENDAFDERKKVILFEIRHF